jgi:acetate kinase
MMKDTVVVLNAGSSSLKFSLFPLDGTDEAMLRGVVDGIGGRNPTLKVDDASGTRVEQRVFDAASADEHTEALAIVQECLQRLAGNDARVACVGHRVVHGGVKYTAPVVVDAAVLADLDVLVGLAPLHQPHNLAAIRAVARALPDVPQVACFDTAFHRSHPHVADMYALPYEYFERGVRRYGFHGLSYEYVAEAMSVDAPAISGGRVVVAHLGSGASLAALRAGRSVDSTMGFTALDGLPMGTRTGQLDPGVVLHLIANEGLSLHALEDLFYRRSGLLGISGVSNDMRELLAADAPRARLAVDYFVSRVAREIGSLAVSLEGIDGLVFTAGIGQHSPEIRQRVCEKLAWLGIDLDPGANAANAPRISSGDSPVSVHVIPTDEERMIARHTVRALARQLQPLTEAIA